MQRPCPQWKTPGRAPGRQRDFFRAVRRGVPVPALRLRYEKSLFRKAGTVVLIEAMLIPHFRLEMARPPRLERGTLCLEGRCSIQLSYGRTLHTPPEMYFARIRIGGKLNHPELVRREPSVFSR